MSPSLYPVEYFWSLRKKRQEKIRNKIKLMSIYLADEENLLFVLEYYTLTELVRTVASTEFCKSKRTRLSMSQKHDRRIKTNDDDDDDEKNKQQTNPRNRRLAKNENYLGSLKQLQI
ncbi:hypothetical protein BLOT_011859 [Blomia tropicalis]|nr:hypothetical protein BLOT_011859 [Blomia tropicalis]